jgi:nitroimidazol reductase NimA-like FMN-containing flavoprotein (pyridoxamine 5'-phosphate oxidase superfamily)
MGKYHILRKDKEITELKEIEEILKKGKYAVVAMSKDDTPYLVTMNYGYDDKGKKLYFHCALEGQKLDYISQNPEVCATIILDGGYKKDHCEQKYASLIIRGKMEIVNDLKNKEHALDVLLNHLEENPAPIKAKTIKNDSTFENFNMLCLSISDITAKKGS